MFTLVQVTSEPGAVLLPLEIMVKTLSSQAVSAMGKRGSMAMGSAPATRR